MKIIFASFTDFDSGMGHKVRIFEVYTQLRKLLRHEQISWLCIISLNRNYFKNRKRIKNELSSFTSDIHILALPEIGPLQKFTSVLGKLYSLFYLIFRYGLSPKNIFWVEMTPSAWPILWYQKIFRNKMVLDVHGVSEEILSLLPDKKMEKIYREAKEREAASLRQATYVITVSEQMSSFLSEEFSIKKEKLTNIPCYSDSHRYNYSLDQIAKFRRENNFENRIAFVYSGGLAPWQCAKQILKCFEKIQSNSKKLLAPPRFLFLSWDNQVHSFIQDQEVSATLRENLIVKVLENSQVPSYLSASDIAFLLREDLLLNRVSSPTKAGEYLHSGLPIVATRHVGDLSQIIERKSCGYIVDDMHDLNIDELIEWFNIVMQNREEFRQRSKKAGQTYFGIDHSNKIRELVQKLEG